MTIDETAERVTPLPPDRVAAYAMDWRNDPEFPPTPLVQLCRVRGHPPRGAAGLGGRLRA